MKSGQYGEAYWFTLSVPAYGIERLAEVIWQQGTQLGVYFLSEPAGTDGRNTCHPSERKTMLLAQLRRLIRG